MLALRHPEETRYLASDQDEYIGLSICDKHNERYNCNEMESLWEPTPAELEALNNGGVIVFQILGMVHPPIVLGAATIQRD